MESCLLKKIVMFLSASLKKHSVFFLSCPDFCRVKKRNYDRLLELRFFHNERWCTERWQWNSSLTSFSTGCDTVTAGENGVKRSEGKRRPYWNQRFSSLASRGQRFPPRLMTYGIQDPKTLLPHSVIVIWNVLFCAYVTKILHNKSIMYVFSLFWSFSLPVVYNNGSSVICV